MPRPPWSEDTAVLKDFPRAQTRFQNREGTERGKVLGDLSVGISPTTPRFEILLMRFRCLRMLDSLGAG